MKKYSIISVIVLLILNSNSLAVNPIPKVNYLEFARSSAEWTWDHYDSLITSWKKNINPEYVFGYSPPGRILEMATIYAFLFELEGNKEYADRAKKVLLTYGDFSQAFTERVNELRADYEDGVPPLPSIFTTMRYLRPYETLKRLGILNKAEQDKIENWIAQSMKHLLRTQEWGTMNRGILRAECLAWAVRAVPDHPQAKTWRMLEKSIGDDNWGNWEIEDASLYNAIWLYSLLGYADALGKLDELFQTPEMYYNAQYFLHLMCPDGIIPDFGDANWHSNWSRYLVFFEATAKAYNDPHLKWAATTIAQKFVDFDQIQNTGLAYMLLDCYRFGSDELHAEPPTELSEEIMEDMVGKKIIFRNGWQPNSTYMLLNYRDEEMAD